MLLRKEDTKELRKKPGIAAVGVNSGVWDLPDDRTPYDNDEENYAPYLGTVRLNLKCP